MPVEKVVALYKANKWSAADKPEILFKALQNSHGLVSAWDGELLIGLSNAITDGYLVVYYPHLLVLPAYQRQGVGYGIMQRIISLYKGFHMHILVADGQAVDFYKKCGFERAGKSEPMWIYAGQDH